MPGSVGRGYCGNKPRLQGVTCELPEGHRGEHQFDTGYGTYRWNWTFDGCWIEWWGRSGGTRWVGDG